MPKLSLIQFEPTTDIKANTKKIKEMTTGLKSDFIVLPEGAFSGYSGEVLNNIEKYAQEIPGEISQTIQKIASRNDAYVISGFIEKSNKDHYNSIVMINPKGETQKRSKSKLAPWAADSKVFKPGEPPTHFNTKFGPIATVICAELRDPSVISSQINEQVLLIFHINAWEKYPNLPKDHELNKTFADRTKLLAARAIEHRAFIASANFAGPEYGHSMIVDPWGDIIAELGEEEGVLNIEIDLKEAERIRQEFPPLNLL